MFLLFIRISMLLFEILIQIIYRGRRVGGSDVITTSQIENAVPTLPYESADASAGDYLEGAGGDALTCAGYFISGG
jgi:hypothetical protein